MKLSHDQLFENYLRYSQDPWAFITECVRTRDEIDKVNPIKLFPDRDYLKLFAKIWQKYPLITVPKSRRMTFSWCVIALYTWECIFFKVRNIAFVSKKEDDADELVKRVKFILDNLDKDKFPRELIPEYKATFCKIEFPQLNSKITGYPQGADQLRQFTFSGIFGDETAFWEEAQKFYSASFPTIDGGGKMTLVSSPAPGFFKKLVFDCIDIAGADIDVESDPEHSVPLPGTKLWINKKNKFLVYTVHYSADPVKRSEAYKQSIKNSMPYQEYMREYECQWSTFEGQPVYPEFNYSHHVISTRPSAELGLPMLCAFDFGLCYDDQTEVLTKDGFKLFKDVDITTDEIATLNPEAFALEYTKAKLKVDMPYNGDMIVADTFNLQFAVTADHIMPTWYDKKELRYYRAIDLCKSPRHKYLRLTANWEGAEQVNPFGLDNIVFAKLMGAYLSEGSTSKDTNRVGIYQLKDKTWISNILKHTHFDWHLRPNCFECSDYNLAQYLRQFGTQEVRFIPNEIKQNTKEAIIAFIEAYTLGDGHKRIRANGAEEHTVFTCSKQMADDFVELALKAGWYASIYKVKPSDSWYEAEQRFIHSNGGYSITFKKKADFAELMHKQVGKVHYEGQVYCLSVPYHTLYVRKNGRAHWNGNTPACIIGQLHEDQLILFEELIEVNMGARRFAQKVKRHILQRYPAWSDLNKDWLCWIDPSGLFRKDTDETTCAQILQDKNVAGFICRPGPITWEERRHAVVKWLMTMTKRGPGLQIYDKGCPTLIKGFQGGYRFNEKAIDVEPLKIRPIKDVYSHCHDATQMLCSGITKAKPGREIIIPSPSYSVTGGR